MAVTKASIYVLNTAGTGHELLREVLPDAPNVNGDVERYAHILAAEWLELHYPSQWLYRYAELKDGVKVGDAGVVESKYTAGHIAGVTDMNLIADSGFEGQFQTRDFSIGLVPAFVRTEDPERDARHAAEQAEYNRRRQERRQALLDILETLPPIILSVGVEEEYAAYVKMNSEDGYSKGAVDFAERWARLMQVEYQRAYKRFEEESGETVADYLNRGGETAVAFWLGAEIGVAMEHADNLSHVADVDGITGFMYGCAVQMLSKFWVHGEALRQWHNGQYGQTGDGVVNPAVLMVGGAQ